MQAWNKAARWIKSILAVSGLDSMTQQNSGLVEEIAGASEEMAAQSKELSGMLERFKL